MSNNKIKLDKKATRYLKDNIGGGGGSSTKKVYIYDYTTEITQQQWDDLQDGAQLYYYDELVPTIYLESDYIEFYCDTYEDYYGGENAWGRIEQNLSCEINRNLYKCFIEWRDEPTYLEEAYPGIAQQIYFGEIQLLLPSHPIYPINWDFAIEDLGENVSTAYEDLDSVVIITGDQENPEDFSQWQYFCVDKHIVIDELVEGNIAIDNNYQLIFAQKGVAKIHIADKDFYKSSVVDDIANYSTIIDEEGNYYTLTWDDNESSYVLVQHSIGGSSGVYVVNLNSTYDAQRDNPLIYQALDEGKLIYVDGYIKTTVIYGTPVGSSEYFFKLANEDDVVIGGSTYRTYWDNDTQEFKTSAYTPK